MWFLISNFVDDVKSHCQKVGCNLNSVIFFKALLFRYEHMYVWKCARVCAGCRCLRCPEDGNLELKLQEALSCFTLVLPTKLMSYANN